MEPDGTSLLELIQTKTRKRKNSTAVYLCRNHDLLFQHHTHTWLATVDWKDYFFYISLRRRKCLHLHDRLTPNFHRKLLHCEMSAKHRNAPCGAISLHSGQSLHFHSTRSAASYKRPRCDTLPDTHRVSHHRPPITSIP